MSEDRKARLAALAARAGRSKPIDDGGAAGGSSDAMEMDSAPASKPSITFRNYVPKDATLDSSTTTPTTSASEANKGEGGSIHDRLESAAHRAKRRKAEEPSSTSAVGGAGGEKTALELALAKANRESREAAGQDAGGGSWAKVTPIAPKKVNWDLKRDIQGKMDRLERRTQRAIVDLLRERLAREAKEGGGDNDSDDSDLD